MRPDFIYEGLTEKDLKPEARDDFALHREAEAIMRGTSQPISLEGSHLEDILVDPNPFPPIFPPIFPDISAQQMLADHVHEVFAPLNDIERRVLGLRFGLTDGRERTLIEVGEVIGKSKSSAWRIEKGALAKLRKPEIAAESQS